MRLMGPRHVLATEENAIAASAVQFAELGGDAALKEEQSFLQALATRHYRQLVGGSRDLGYAELAACKTLASVVEGAANRALAHIAVPRNSAFVTPTTRDHLLTKRVQAHGRLHRSSQDL